MHSTSTCASETHGNNHAANNVGGSNRATVKYEKRPVGATESQVSPRNISLFSSEASFLRIMFFFCTTCSLLFRTINETYGRKLDLNVLCHCLINVINRRLTSAIVIFQ